MSKQIFTDENGDKWESTTEEGHWRNDFYYYIRKLPKAEPMPELRFGDGVSIDCNGSWVVIKTYERGTRVMVATLRGMRREFNTQEVTEVWRDLVKIWERK